ncbi:Growth arrest and DNA damage-inducible protein GADD45 alpha [Larimichthys crocea]|uniref:Uncharacterized protein n=1 Tax=Larimichthys crocea TaxID=215358 RepID=A0ACD3QRX5_LARCR|nr:Growth arrest and DNA damage-inducible protein GADD45 alpha [Larimichthys crocea]
MYNMTFEELSGDYSQERMDSVAKALEEVLTSALPQGCITVGVYEAAKSLNVDPDNVVLCILATDDEDVKDVALQIHFTLIQAFCCENDINILRVNNTRRLAEILGGGGGGGGKQSGGEPLDPTLCPRYSGQKTRSERPEWPPPANENRLSGASVQQFSDSNVCRLLLKQHFLPDAVTTHAAKALLVAMITHGFIVALYLYPLNARLYSQLLHRPPGMSDVIGTVSLRRHPGQINTATKKNKEKVCSLKVTSTNMHGLRHQQAHTETVFVQMMESVQTASDAAASSFVLFVCFRDKEGKRTKDKKTEMGREGKEEVNFQTSGFGVPD